VLFITHESQTASSIVLATNEEQEKTNIVQTVIQEGDDLLYSLQAILYTPSDLYALSSLSDNQLAGCKFALALLVRQAARKSLADVTVVITLR